MWIKHPTCKIAVYVPAMPQAVEQPQAAQPAEKPAKGKAKKPASK